MTIEVFAHDLRSTLLDQLAPAEVSFLGSFARGEFDEFSDVDLEAKVHIPLNEQFFAELEAFLTDRYGPALVRYDPDFRSNTTAQGVRFSFYQFPIFWRLDLTVRSSTTTGKHPSPFPEWQVGTSALMNVVWAIKGYHRRSITIADHYLGCAFDKLGLTPLSYSDAAVRSVLVHLRNRSDADPWLLAQIAKTVNVTIA